MKPVIYFVLVLIVFYRAVFPKSSRIWNGTVAEPHSTPYQAFLNVQFDGYSLNCSGTLITPSYILTTAYCIADAINATITLGAYKIFENESTQLKLSSNVFKIYPNYNSLLGIDDIGLIELGQQIELTEAIQTVKLASGNDTYEGLTARLTGWGSNDTSTATYSMSNELLYVDVIIISNSKCIALWWSDIPETIICSDVGEAGCFGDEGGPLMINDTQIGMLSFFAGECYSPFPNGFTRIASYLDWIIDNSDLTM